MTNIEKAKQIIEQAITTGLERFKFWDNSYLLLGDLNLTSGELKQLIPMIQEKLPNLKEFWSWGNALTSVPDSIAKFTNLRKLHLENNRLTSLTNSIGHLKRLTVLNLSNNKLINLPDSIGHLECLTDLNLNNNKLFAGCRTT